MSKKSVTFTVRRTKHSNASDTVNKNISKYSLQEDATPSLDFLLGQQNRGVYLHSSAATFHKALENTSVKDDIVAMFDTASNSLNHVIMQLKNKWYGGEAGCKKLQNTKIIVGTKSLSLLEFLSQETEYMQVFLGMKKIIKLFKTVTRKQIKRHDGGYNIIGLTKRSSFKGDNFKHCKTAAEAKQEIASYINAVLAEASIPGDPFNTQSDIVKAIIDGPTISNNGEIEKPSLGSLSTLLRNFQKAVKELGPINSTKQDTDAYLKLAENMNTFTDLMNYKMFDSDLGFYGEASLLSIANASERTITNSATGTADIIYAVNKLNLDLDAASTLMDSLPKSIGVALKVMNTDNWEQKAAVGSKQIKELFGNNASISPENIKQFKYFLMNYVMLQRVHREGDEVLINSDISSIIKTIDTYFQKLLFAANAIAAIIQHHNELEFSDKSNLPGFILRVNNQAIYTFEVLDNIEQYIEDGSIQMRMDYDLPIDGRLYRGLVGMKSRTIKDEKQKVNNKKSFAFSYDMLNTSEISERLTKMEESAFGSSSRSNVIFGKTSIYIDMAKIMNAQK